MPPCVALRDEIKVPGWYIWRSSADRYWACRTGQVHWWDRPRDPAWAMCVDADTEDELRAELAEQRKLDAKAGPAA